MGRYRDPLAIFALALGLRLLFSLLMANTYDVDEFVYLALSKDVSQGAIPYRDFPFFHPPGILVLLSLLNPFTSAWWPIARLVDVLIDSGTAVMVWRVGAQLYDRRGALAAGALYAAGPLVLVSAVRIDQEVIITALSMAALTLLLTRHSTGTAALAGACIGIACWVKYPAAIILPVYLAMAGRRAGACLVGFSVACLALFAPFLPEARRVVDDTVIWQLFHRNATPLGLRLLMTAAFWLGVNPFALLAVRRRVAPRWLVAAFATGGIFLFTSVVYPHYFVPIAPFAALLGAPVAATLFAIRARTAIAGAAGVAIASAVAISVTATERGFGLASRFSDARPIVQLVDRATRPGTPILVSSFEYAYLAGRPWIDHYFWNDQAAVSAHTLDERLLSHTVVVQDPQSDQKAYPPGLATYLDARYPRVTMRGASIWLVGQSRAKPGRALYVSTPE